MIQSLGILFVIYGIQSLFYSINLESTLNLVKDFENDNKYSESINLMKDFLLERFFWTFIPAILSLIIICFINWKREKSFYNTIVVFLFVFLFFLSGILFTNKIYDWFAYFLQFIKINKYTLIVETITMTIFGALLLWKSNNLKILEDNSLNQN